MIKNYPSRETIGKSTAKKKLSLLEIFRLDSPRCKQNQEKNQNLGAGRVLQQHHYEFKTKPFNHQSTAFSLSRDAEFFALLMEQGTGKSKVLIDTAAWLFGQGKIIGLLVVAPNGVHRNWIINEIPAHLPDYIPRVCAYWSASPKKAERLALENLLTPTKHQSLRVLAINYEALRTEKGIRFIEKFLLSFKTMAVADESQRIKNASPRQTKVLLRLRHKAPYRRISTGTPITEAPLNAYTQFKFLDEGILGFSSMTCFKAHFAEILPSDHPLMRKVMMKAKYPPQLVAKDHNGKPKYKNLEELKSLISAHSYRVLKSECLDLPNKLYQRMYVELSKEQRQLYDQLKEDYLADFEGGKINVAMALTRLLRLQQVIGGFAPVCDETGEPKGMVKPVGNINPRTAALFELSEDLTGKAIIWARFRPELAAIAKGLRELHGHHSVVEYHGGISNADRQSAVDFFQGEHTKVEIPKGGGEAIITKTPIPKEKQARFFVGQPRSGGLGLTLTAATTVIYYSNDFSLETRLQSEDRAHRIGQHHPVTYIDFEAPNTVDGKVIAALRSKKDVADIITGDEIKEWLQSS